MANAKVCTVKDGDETFVPISGMEEASLKIFQSQVLLPLSLEDGSVRAFLGPFVGQNKKKFGNSLLPKDSSTLPFIHSTEIDLALFGDSTKIFRAFPPIKDRHSSWLTRVESSMHSLWEEIGISEFIQLAKFDLHLFDPQMLLSAIFFWNRETRAFEFPCGFVCPTLLDIAAITGLAPIGDRFYPDVFEEKISIKETSISWDKKTYLAFINAHMGKIRILHSGICELEGARLTTLTPRKRSINNFAKYIDAILSFTEFSEDLAPFIRTTLTGPSWLRQNNQVGSITPDSNEMWFGFLSWDVIISGMRQKDVRVYPYQPQLFSRQFGLCQMKPLPLRRKESIDADICVETGNYEEVLEFILRAEKQLRLTPCTFSSSFLVSKCFLRWWCEYYVDKILNFDDFLKKLINSPLSSQGPKQTSTYKNQTIIYQFEQFFKVCYRLDSICRTIFDASVSLSKMVQRKIRSKKVINPRGKTDFEKFCPKNIPSLPNARFGLVKHLSHPPWVKTLDPFYLEHKAIPVKDQVTYARCSMYDFPRRRWWPLC
uniref:Aminotransferase-like plant mobile domain-containing protein n=1 Tax=Cajanus cajan TaxID=3821 RepID=A0A151RFX2_CAJCA|nr:hypothetical protein KK1_037325 [Cajanus cajan]